MDRTVVLSTLEGPVLTPPVPRVAAVPAFVPAVLALTICLSVPESALPQGTQSGRRIASEASVAIRPLLGPWMRNERLSEDPALKVETMWRIQRLVAPGLRELVRGLDQSLDTVLIRVPGKSTALLDGLGKSRKFPLSGASSVFHTGARGRIWMSGSTLMIETVGKGWLQIEKFELKNEKLIRDVELKSGNLPYLTIRTIYDRPWTALGHRLDITREGGAQPATLRIVPPDRGHRELLSGTVDVRTLVIDPGITAVEFYVDGKATKRVGKQPYRARIPLATPPREQILEVRAYDRHGASVGGDTIVLNRIHAPFGVRITGIRSEEVNGDTAVKVATAISVPGSATVERVAFYRSQHLVATIDDLSEDPGSATPRTIPVEALIEDVGPADFVRVTARLSDGREREDAELLHGAAHHHAEIDVQLVQIQVLVTDPDGYPVRGLLPGEFEILESGVRKQVENLHTADDVSLVLGLAIDSSDSMLRIWRELNDVADRFLENSLAQGDRAFLVDFDETVRLLQPLTGNKSMLSKRLAHLLPLGGTALNDGILFSLLQYRSEPGRRALVVVTDGADLHSRSKPSHSADFAERIGLPIYFIELDHTTAYTEVGDPSARKRIRGISRQTGGRRFVIQLADDDPPLAERIEQVFDQIQNDLRHQHVLTYYSDLPLGTAVEPEVRVTRRGLRLRSAVPLEAIE